MSLHHRIHLRALVLLALPLWGCPAPLPLEKADGGTVVVVPPADSGTIDTCDGVDTQVDPNHCGGCGQACAYRTTAFATCAQGSCVYACQPGYADCDGDLGSATGNGCEVELATSLDHCGACGNTCTAGGGIPGATSQCSAGSCVARCQEHLGDCDLDLKKAGGNGCETDLRADPANCGECLWKCTGASACVEGACTGSAPECRLFAGEAPRPAAAALATDGSSSALAWVDADNQGLWVALLDGRGETLRAPRRITAISGTAGTTRLALAWDGSHYVVGWSESTSPGRLSLQRLSPGDLASAGTPAQVQLSSAHPGSLLAAGRADRALFLGWGSTASTVNGVVWRDGQPQPDAPRPVTLPGEPASGVYGLASVRDAFVLAWVAAEKADPNAQPAYLLGTLRLDPDGAATGSMIDNGPLWGALVAGANLASMGERAVLVGAEAGSIPRLRSLVFDETGTPVNTAGRFSWNDVAQGSGVSGVVAGDAAGAWVLERDFPDGAAGPELRFRRLDADGKPAGAALRIGPTVGSPYLHLVPAGQGGALAVWRRFLFSSGGLSLLGTAFVDGAQQVGSACGQ